MKDTSPWSFCSCQSPWLPCFGHTISSTGPSVSPFRDFFLIKPLFLIIIQKPFFQLAKKAAEKAEKEKDASPNPSDSDKVKQKQRVVVLGNETTPLQKHLSVWMSNFFQKTITASSRFCKFCFMYETTRFCIHLLKRENWKNKTFHFRQTKIS